MSGGSYSIVGGDLKRAGTASRALKERLKRIGVEPQTVRRAMISAFEAEMNVVIHAHQGTMRFSIDPRQIDIEVSDKGPGIPDIALAMQEGYSTAPAYARELGFGAGMGLPNIKKNSDHLNIQSVVGEGTRLYVTILLKAQNDTIASKNSVHVAAEACRECLRCVRACPTRAIRVRRNTPEILDHLCIDCGACIEVCDTGALRLDGKSDIPKPSEDALLVIHPSFFVQFGAAVRPRDVFKALAHLGFYDVRLTDGWEHALREAVLDYAKQHERTRPVISPTCPAVVNLIEMRFPSLIPHLAPFLSPVEAVQHELAGDSNVFVAACPAQRTALLANQPPTPDEVVAPMSLRKAILRLETQEALGADATPRHPCETHADSRGILQVTGIPHVLRVLEHTENGLLRDVAVLHLCLCTQGCFGAPLSVEDPFVAQHRWGLAYDDLKSSGKAVPRKSPFSPRAGMRLDPDMAKAIAKLAQIDDLTRRLPGKDCGLCGAPTCSAFAEDVALRRAPQTACRCLGDQETKP
ncbi:MAG: 4Fe-4S dicluster domain-containing protein [Planctomycetes bacterium]|nr:4Fe-4S dicluster domain-containing protein [Planctomycetota bacterium]